MTQPRTAGRLRALPMQPAIPDGRHTICLKMDGVVATLHTGAAACAAPDEIPER